MAGVIVTVGKPIKFKVMEGPYCFFIQLVRSRLMLLTNDGAFRAPAFDFQMLVWLDEFN
jgi:hypothetical protein